MSIDMSGISGEPIQRQLAALIAAGVSAEDAANKVLAPYRPAPLADFAWPAVRNEAFGLERKHHRKVEDNALSGAGKKVRQEAKMRLPVTSFRLGDGTEVEWGRATVDQHRARIAWQGTQRAAIDLDIDRHKRAVELIESLDATCLDDIDDWVDLLGDRAIGEVA